MVGCLNLLPPQSHAGNIAERIPRYRPGFTDSKQKCDKETHRDTTKCDMCGSSAEAGRQIRPEAKPRD